MADLSGYHVLASDKIDTDGLQILRDAGVQVTEKTGMTEDELAACIGEYDGLVIRSATKVTPKIIDAAERLVIIARAGVGVNNIVLPAATKQGIVVVNSPEGNTIAAAEHTWAMILSLVRQIPPAHTKLVGGTWDRKTFMGTEMAGKTLGVVGFGRIGRRVAQYAKGMGMEVVCYDPFVGKAQAQRAGARLADLNDVLRTSDVITLHMPATKETQGMLGADALQKVKKGVFIANVARGELVDPVALYEACKSGRVAGAALDVFDKEPPNFDHPLFGLPNVYATPHLGASTKEAQVKVAVDVCQQMVEVFRGGPARSAVNIPSMRPELIKPVQRWIGIAEKLGRLANMLLGKAPATTLTIEYAGEVGRLDSAPLTTVLLKGFLTRTSGSGVANFVNAPLIAKERGLTVTTQTAPERNFSSLITVRASDGKGSVLEVAGTSFGAGLGDRLTSFYGVPLDIELNGSMCFMRHKDEPGALAETCRFFARKGLNINNLALGRVAGKGSDGVHAVQLDSPLDDEGCREIVRDCEMMQSAITLTFTTPDEETTGQGVSSTFSATHVARPRRAKL